MDKSLHSQSWYRVADKRPRLRSHVRLHRQHFRGQLWYVMQDHASGRFHRFTPAAYLVISMLDGRTTVGRIWNAACDILGDDVLTQDETIRLLAQLHQSDVLHTDVPPDAEEVSRRGARQKRRRIIMSFANPMAVRVPLLDPDEFLSATLPVVSPLLSWFGALLATGIIGTAVFQAAIHWPELTQNIGDRVLATESLFLLLATYPFVKALHELGHGYAVKKWGGEVHEMGIMFLVFMPVPYVDASAAAAFREKWRRAFVGAAGIIVELLLASIALFVWLEVEEGLVRAFAFNVMIIGTVSTVLFNGNPLLRFDGYYVLADILEIPNLGNRANRYLRYLVQRFAFGVQGAVSPATAPSEPLPLVLYGIASFAYRMFIATVIVFFVATKMFIVGVLLAIWASVMMFGVPLGKGVWFVLTSPLLRRRRGRAFAVCLGFLAAVAAVLFMVPVPYATVAEGVIWTPGEAMVRARTDGTIAKLYRPSNVQVEMNEPLILLEDPLLDAEVRAVSARHKGLQLRYEVARVIDQAEAKILARQLEHSEADLRLLQQRQRDLRVNSPAVGEFVLLRPGDTVGRFVHKGDLLGYVMAFDSPIMRVVVPENSVDVVRHRTRHSEVWLAGDMGNSHPVSIERELPVVSNELPSPALSTAGGGDVYLDPTDPQKMKALERLLQLELRFTRPMRVPTMGGRIYVRFDHGSEAIAWRVYRSLRQLFLKRFNV